MRKFHFFYFETSSLHSELPSNISIMGKHSADGKTVDPDLFIVLKDRAQNDSLDPDRYSYNFLVIWTKGDF